MISVKQYIEMRTVAFFNGECWCALGMLSVPQNIFYFSNVQSSPNFNNPPNLSIQKFLRKAVQSGNTGTQSGIIGLKPQDLIVIAIVQVSSCPI